MHQSGDAVGASTKYENILQGNPNQPDALHYLGVYHYQCGNKELAENLIKKAISISPHISMYKNLILVLKSSGKLKEAIEILELEALNNFPSELELLFILSGLQRDDGRMQECRETLIKIIKISPEWPEALMNLANVEKNVGNYENAEALYIKAINIKGVFPEAFSNLGAYYSERGDFLKALEYNKKAVQTNPHIAAFQYNLGNAYLALSRSSEAQRCFEEALKIDPNYLNALVNLAASRQQAGDIETALELMRKIELIDPQNSKLYINLGNMALTLRRYEESLNYLKKGIALEPQNFTAWTTGAEVLRQLGRYDDARKAVEKGLEIEPLYGRALMILATIEEMENNNKKAEQALKTALQKPYHLGLLGNAADRRAEAKLRLANLYTNQGDEERGFATYLEGLNDLNAIRSNISSLNCQDKSDQIPIILFQPIGRAGSLFVHSLVDGHPSISTTPAVLMKGFFGEGIWEGMEPDWKNLNGNWKHELIERFCTIYEPLLNSKSPLPVPGNPLGEPSNVAAGCGLTKMGPKRDLALQIDMAQFKKNLYRNIKEYQKIDAASFFRVIHKAWDESIGKNSEIKTIFFHIHNPDTIELASALIGFKKIKFLNIVRNPLQAVESWMLMCVQDLSSPELLLKGYQSAIEKLQLTLQQAGNIVYKIYPSTTIRLEDIKRNTDATLKKLCEWLEVKDDACLRHPTFAGIEYEPPASTPVNGFETSNLERKPGALFSENDQRVMDLLLYPIAVQYGYREADPEYLEREIAWYKLLISEALDFEKAILSQLDHMGYKKDTTGPRRHFESIAQRCVNLLEKFGTYPAMAPWLRVD